MNEKLRNVLLRLATEPLDDVKTALNSFTPEEVNSLSGAEKKLKNAIAGANVNTKKRAFQLLFLHDDKQGNENVSEQLLKPFFIVHAKLNASERDADFYTDIIRHTTAAKIAGPGEDWVSNVLTEISPQDLLTILNNASPEELSTLLYNLKNKKSPEAFQRWLEKLTSPMWDIYFSKLSLLALEEMNVINVVKKSPSACESLANYLIQNGTNKIELSDLKELRELREKEVGELWAWVQKNELLKVETLIDAIAKIDTPFSKAFNSFCFNFEENKEIPANLWEKAFAVLIEPDGNPIFKTFNINEQMIVYGLLAVLVGQFKIEVKKLRSSFGKTEQDLSYCEDTLKQYIKISPFLAAFSKAQIFTRQIELFLERQFVLASGTAKGYLQLAGCLPPGEEAKALEKQANVPQPRSRPVNDVFYPLGNLDSADFFDDYADFSYTDENYDANQDEGEIDFEMGSEEYAFEQARRASLNENFSHNWTKEPEKKKVENKSVEDKYEALPEFSEEALKNLLRKNQVKAKEIENYLPHARELHFNDPLLSVEELAASIYSYLTTIPTTTTNTTTTTTTTTIPNPTPIDSFVALPEESSEAAQRKNGANTPTIPNNSPNPAPVNTSVENQSIRPSNPKIALVAPILAGLVSGLALALILCFSALAFPLWVIPIVTVGGMFIGLGITLALTAWRSHNKFNSSSDGHIRNNNSEATLGNSAPNLAQSALSYSQDAILTPNQQPPENKIRAGSEVNNQLGNNKHQ